MPKPADDSLIAQLVELRRTLGVSTDELAQRMCVTRSQVSNLENPRYSPMLATLERWAGALGYELMLTAVPRTTVDQATCAECGNGIYRHANVPWLHTETGLVWCWRDVQHTETARP